ncbi:hypothetical protein AAG570_008986 [Ranatra chinensis]|uniref:Acetyl-CoA acetyltransferase, cytosolic n=1 Tax=Ranatra chinensis TaxID=642074 RepID=A0ABD0YSF8_9HEMI
MVFFFIGSFCGSLSQFKAHQLGSIVIKEVLQRAKLKPSDVSEVIMGQALSAGEGQNPARQAAVNAGIPVSVPAFTVNKLCGSGLQSVILGIRSLRCGDSRVVVCGGQESMSQSPHCINMRSGVKMGNASLADTLLKDGLTDAFSNIHMGVTAENVAEKYSISRSVQDDFALESQKKTEAAQKSGVFRSEIVEVTVEGKKGSTVVSQDEHPRHGTTSEGLKRLKPVFLEAGTVTAGNASGVNDGAAVVVLTKESVASQLGLPVMAKIIAYAEVGIEPEFMGMAPVPAIQDVLRRAGWSHEDVDLFEINEAFAAQSVAVIKELGLKEEKVNVNGGAIALGHPIGASGARILVTLIHNLVLKHLKKGVAALCIGGGMGVAVAIEIIV